MENFFSYADNDKDLKISYLPPYFNGIVLNASRPPRWVEQPIANK